MTHKVTDNKGRKVITKFLTERQIKMLQQRRKVWFQVEHVLVILRPKSKNQKLMSKIEKYKAKIKALQEKIK